MQSRSYRKRYTAPAPDPNDEQLGRVRTIIVALFWLNEVAMTT